MSHDLSKYTEKQATELREEVRAAVQAATKATIRVCRALYEVRWGTVVVKGEAVPLALAWGYDGSGYRLGPFGHYAEKEVEIHEGRAQAYVLVYDELCTKRNFSEGELPASITKLIALARVSNHVKDGRVVNSWIGRARELGCCELEDAIETEVFSGKGKKRTLSFYMKWSRVAPLMKTIREARERFGVPTNGEALTKIVDEWSVGKPTSSEKRRAG